MITNGTPLMTRSIDIDEEEAFSAEIKYRGQNGSTFTDVFPEPGTSLG